LVKLVTDCRHLRGEKEGDVVINQSAPAGTIAPHLIYESDGKVGHSRLSIGDSGVVLGAARLGTGFATPDPVKSGARPI